jgi:hypothetical protein
MVKERGIIASTSSGAIEKKTKKMDAAFRHIQTSSEKS